MQRLDQYRFSSCNKAFSKHYILFQIKPFVPFEQKGGIDATMDCTGRLSLIVLKRIFVDYWRQPDFFFSWRGQGMPQSVPVADRCHLEVFRTLRKTTLLFWKINIMHRCYDLFLFGDSNKMYTFPMKTFAGINFQMMSETIGIIVQYLIPNEQSLI